MGLSSKLLKGMALASAALISINIGAVADGHGERPEAEIARDAGRKPEAVMKFLGVEPGMTIFEPSASSGYYTALLSKAVGSSGKVYAQNSPRFWDRLKENAEPRYKELGNVEAHIGQVTDFNGADGSIDMIPITLIYHHLHFNADSGNGTPENSKAFYAKAMQMLKPGGIIAIVEHQAADGTPRAESAAWHRASLQNAIDDLTGAGFEYVGNSDVLANPDDPQNIHFRDLTSGRDTSQRFVAKFRKPE